jgi:hypothetical protein
VSYKGQEWELYNLEKDRAENVNVAEKHPKRVKEMVKKWKQMSRDVLHSEKLANAEMKPADKVKSNSQWTKFSDSDKPPVKRAGPRKRKKKKL